MATFSIWHWFIVLLIVLMVFAGRRAAPVRWLPLLQCGTGLLIAWLLFALLRGL